jgi:GGDEF domain-containing protein
VNTLAELVVERIASAAELREATTRDSLTGLLGHDYVEARLIDELTVAAPERPAAFALVRLVNLTEIEDSVGADGLAYVAKELVRRARSILPDEVVLGLARTNELAVLFPDTTAQEAAPLLTFALDSIEELTLPGGAVVPLRLAAGVASYPDHAGDADALYMATDAALTNAVDRHESVAVAL